MGYTTSEIVKLIKASGASALDPSLLAESSESNIASAIYDLDANHCRSVLRLLDNSSAAAVMSEMPNDLAADILSKMREIRALDVIEEFDPDDAADIVFELDEGNKSRLFGKLDGEIAESIEHLLTFGPDTAGGIMTPEFAGMTGDMTVDQAIAKIRILNEKLETFYYIYILDANQCLQGVVSMRQLVLANQDQRIDQIMVRDLLGVCQVDMDKEEVARQMGLHNLLALPVVGDRNELLGIVTHDDILDVIQDEATEDLQKLLGAGGDEQLSDSVSYAFKKRAPWLLVNLFTSCFAAAVIYHYQAVISQFTLLAVFLPVVANIAGNTGSQTLAVSIRSVSTEAILNGPERLFSICFKESIKGLISGLPVSIVASLLGIGLAIYANFTFDYSFRLGIALLLSMQLSMALSSFTGVFVPMMLRRLGLDPAQSASIFLTAFTDIAGFFLFLRLGIFLLYQR